MVFVCPLANFQPFSFRYSCVNVCVCLEKRGNERSGAACYRQKEWMAENQWLAITARINHFLKAENYKGADDYSKRMGGGGIGA